MACLLDPHTGGVRPPGRGDPADHRRAINDVVALLAGDAAAVASSARRMADLVCREIDRCDRAAAAFARDASPNEVERLTVQLGVLDQSADRDGADRRELRDLVSHQLDVVRRMQTRREAAEQRSAHLFYLLRGLWAQLCVLRNVSVNGPAAVARQSDHVRDLCSEMSRALDGNDPLAHSAETRDKG